MSRLATEHGDMMSSNMGLLPFVGLLLLLYLFMAFEIGRTRSWATATIMVVGPPLGFWAGMNAASWYGMLAAILTS